MRDCLRIQENCEGHVFRMMDSYDHANRLTQVTQGSLATQYVYNGDGVRTSKTAAGDTTEYALDLLATLPVVISDTDAVYLYGLDIIAQQHEEMLYYTHDGRGSSSRWAARVSQRVLRLDVMVSFVLAVGEDVGFSLYEDIQMRDIYGLTNEQIAYRAVVRGTGGLVTVGVVMGLGYLVLGTAFPPLLFAVPVAIGVELLWEATAVPIIFEFGGLYGAYEPRRTLQFDTGRAIAGSPLMR
jgi:YD repeat-containing protein